MIPPWNLTSSGRRLRDADALVISVGKSGRTWLRVLINKYISLQYGVPFGVDDLSRQNRAIPSIVYTHELWEYVSKAGLKEKLLGKYLVPEGVLRCKPVVLLYRDPRDVVVSLYFQYTRRLERRLEARIGEFIYDSRLGVRSIVGVMNAWRTRLTDHPRCLWLRYEDMRLDPRGQLARCIPFLGVGGVREDFLEQAVAFAAFENMQRMEASGAFQGKVLRPGDPADPQSFKVREGKVGGFRRHFNGPEVEYLDRAVCALDPFFGYPA